MVSFLQSVKPIISMQLSVPYALHAPPTKRLLNIIE